MEEMAGTRALAVRQRKEWGEILTGFETRNRYGVYDADGRELYLAAEVSGSFLSRTFLGNWRPFEIQVLTPDGRGVLTIRRPFRWFLHEIDVSAADGRVLGSVKQRFAWLRRRFTVRDGSGREIGHLHGPILHPWTFEIREADRVLGRIVKRWSGLGKEAFTDADNFAVEFPHIWDVDRKAVFLGAVFLIDFLYFERSGQK
jgi:uncharacterized protein YxjI